MRLSENSKFIFEKNLEIHPKEIKYEPIIIFFFFFFFLSFKAKETVYFIFKIFIVN